MSRSVPSSTGSTVVEPVSGDVRVALEPSDVATSSINRLRAIASGGFPSTYTRRLKTGLRLSGILAGLVAAGCSSSPTDPATTIASDPVSEIESATVEITPGELQTPGGTPALLTATVRDEEGQVLAEEVEWTTIDPSVAIVDADGTVWSFKSGSTPATATYPGKSGSSGGKALGRATKNADVDVGDTPERPGQVADLSVDTTTASSVTLSFTEVDDGQGAAADYLIRFETAPLSWGAAIDATGDCAAPLSGAGEGTTIVCTVGNLSHTTVYQFQVVAIRTVDEVHGELSNVTSGTTSDTETSSEPDPEPEPEPDTEPEPEPVPPPSGTGANEPDSYQVISSRSFDHKGEGAWTDATYGNFAVGVVDEGAVSAFSGRVKFPAGMSGGISPVSVATALNFTGRSELYVQFWVKFDDNWQGHDSGVNKILFLTDKSYGGGGDPAFIAVYGANSSTLTLQVRLQGPGSEQSASIASANLKPNLGSSGSIQRGQWHRVELVLVMNSGTNHDGEAHAWLDGTKVIEYRDVRFEDASGSNHLFDNVRWNPTWGGMDDTVASDMYMWMDEIYVSGS